MDTDLLALLEKRVSKTQATRRKKNAGSREAYHDNIEREKRRAKKSYDEQRKGHRRLYQHHIKKYYNLTEEDVARMLNTQNLLCANVGCGTDIRSLDRETHIDHNHTTGKVRGLLCRNCNSALGVTRESVAVLAGLISYLATYSIDK